MSMVDYVPSAIEARWQAAWNDASVFESDVDSSRPKFYCLEMFPYPSGQMHMGHVRNYSIGDSMARFRRLAGYNVLYPMGYDSFGMPAENAARKIGGHPHDVTWSNIESIRSDLNRMGFSSIGEENWPQVIPVTIVGISGSSSNSMKSDW